MQVKSLGYRTDLIFPAFDAEILDRGDYLVVRTPNNPNFYWGNFLLFPGPPSAQDLQRWPQLFFRELGGPPKTKHQTFGWDTTEGEVGAAEQFETKGFKVLRSVVLATDLVHPPPRPAASVQVRALNTDSEWEQALDNQVRNREAEFEEAPYRIFRKKEAMRYRAMVDAGLGNWYGAFKGERLVADMGIFHDGELGRYQSVTTDAEHRRQGIAGTMVYEGGRQALEEHSLSRLVMIADEGSSPQRIYESVGFQLVERQVGLEWLPEHHQGDRAEE